MPTKRNLNRLAKGITTLIFVLVALFATTPQGQEVFSGVASPGTYRVVRVADGDTIDVNLNGKTEPVRLIGIDTPETHDPRKAVQCFGEAAAIHTKSLVEGKNVRLVSDPENSNRDKYRRLLRYVYLPDGSLLNSALIKDGYAFAYTVFPYSKLDEFRQLEGEARDNNRGLWAGCSVDDSTQVKQTTGIK